ncbi:site-specific integrase [Streptomyces sp. KD18]|nr:site-specific integrase [Streptomyces sp. KD18]GGT11529.1 hypothetical protein GCM10010286_41620 [Streptomyces toxytricini]
MAQPRIAGLRRENVGLEHQEIRIRTQRQRVGEEAYEDDPNGRRRRQTLPLPRICVAPLRWQRLRQAAGEKDAGLRVVWLHDARHGTATLLTAAGVPPRVVMEILGHSQIAVTMNVYTHVVQDTQREASGHLDRLLRKRAALPIRSR